MSAHARIFAAILAAGMGAGLASASHAAEPAPTPVPEGKTLAFDRTLGNCLACHQMAGGELAGTIGPPLIAMKARYPDAKALRAQIADATVRNPRSVMPPFGRHRILTDEQIDKITAFVHTL